MCWCVGVEIVCVCCVCVFTNDQIQIESLQCVKEKEYRKAGNREKIVGAIRTRQLSKWFPHLIQWVVIVEQVLLEHFRYEQIRLYERQSIPAQLPANGTTGNVLQWRWFGCLGGREKKRQIRKWSIGN